MELLKKANGNIPRTEEEKLKMIEEMSHYYGKFLTAAGFDWQADDHSRDTPMRVAKSWINDLVAGSISEFPKMSSFSNEDSYTGLVAQTNITINSICCHHNLSFFGVAHISYIPGKGKDSKMLGLSKLNKIAQWYAQRPNVQESLTAQIHTKVNELCEGNRGVAVTLECKHLCVKCRGQKDNSTMKTTQLSGYFFDNEATRNEYFHLIDQSRF